MPAKKSPAKKPVAKIVRTAPAKMISMDVALARYWTKYADFTGRATRAEFWWCQLIYGLLGGFLYFAATLGMPSIFGAVMLGLYICFAIATLVPGWSLTARRLHDTNLSGWWQLWWILILLGAYILFIIMMALSGMAGSKILVGLFAIIMSLSAIAWCVVAIVRLARRSNSGPNKFGAPSK